MNDRNHQVLWVYLPYSKLWVSIKDTNDEEIETELSIYWNITWLYYPEANKSEMVYVMPK